MENIEIVDGVKVHIIKSVKFNEYVMAKYQINMRIYGIGVVSLFANEYLDFCVEHDLGAENSELKRIQNNLTERGMKMYEQVEEYRKQIKQATNNDDKQKLIAELNDFRYGIINRINTIRGMV